jgi:phage gp29-like protein
MYWGFSLVQFHDLIKDEFSSIELIPRQFVKPEFHVVTKTWTEITGNDYLAEPYNKWCIGVGMPKDLGLLMKAAPLCIWKKNALGAWAEFQNIFGVPARIGKTNLKDAQTFQNMVDMLSNWGLSQYGVFGKDDMVELIESSNSDAYEVFDKMIERVNSEISKLILGQTSTISEKSFVGSAEVHERVLNNYAEKDEQFLESVHNYQLVPFLREFGLLGEGDRIECDDSEELSQEDHNKLVIELLKTGRYTIPPEYIEETLGIPVEVSEPMNTVAEVKNKLEEYYN